MSAETAQPDRESSDPPSHVSRNDPFPYYTNLFGIVQPVKLRRAWPDLLLSRVSRIGLSQLKPIEFNFVFLGCGIFTTQRLDIFLVPGC